MTITTLAVYNQIALIYLQLKISDQTYSLGAFLGKDPDEVRQNKQEKLESQIADVSN